MAAIDEMVDGRGGVRPHWRGLLGAMTELDTRALSRRAERLARAAEEEGAAAGEGEPGWRCDPVPLLLAAREFAELADGLAQRARLLEALLADLYGPQQVLARGALPPPLVFTNPGFERACCGLPGPFLHAYAADLVRGPDGQWRVLADRLGGAPGIAHAAENRRLLARVLPELFRPVQVEPLRPFFEAWQETLGGSTGLVAVLASHAGDPHWPEHLALARALGCAVVEPRDLTVRDGILLFKTLAELRPVGLVLRRVASGALDPLELGRGGGAGITGLLDAIRAGKTRVLNAPGTELAEAPGLGAFLPALSRILLGEPLRLATVPALWLADRGAQAMVRQAPQRWAVRPATDGEVAPAALGDLLPALRASLDAAIAEQPWDWAASVVIAPSLAPCVGAEGLEPRPVVLRLFLVRNAAAWHALPGGVARVLEEGEWPGAAMPVRALVKDVWVLREEEGSAPVMVRFGA